MEQFELKQSDRFFYAPRFLQPLPIVSKPYCPRHWALHRIDLRAAIFEKCYEQRASFRAALDAEGPDTKFLFAKAYHRADYIWTTGERETNLRQRFFRWPGKNLLGKALAAAHRHVSAGIPQEIDLQEWLDTDQTFGKDPRYATLVVSDSSLKHLAWLESGIPIVKGGAKFRHVPALLQLVNLDLFKHIIIHVGVLDQATPMDDAKRDLLNVIRLVRHRPKSVWWSAPLPTGVYDPETHTQFKAWLRHQCRKAGIKCMDVADDHRNVFRGLNGPINPHLYYSDQLHLNGEGVRNLLKVWEQYVPFLRLFDRGVSARPYQQAYRPNQPETLPSLNSFR